MSGNFEGIKTRHVDIGFIYKSRSTFLPENLIRRKNLQDYSVPSKADMILDAGYCREKCQSQFFVTDKKKKVVEDNKFGECLGMCFNKLNKLDEFMRSGEYVEALIDGLRTFK